MSALMALRDSVQVKPALSHSSVIYGLMTLTCDDPRKRLYGDPRSVIVQDKSPTA